MVWGPRGWGPRVKGLPAPGSPPTSGSVLSQEEMGRRSCAGHVSPAHVPMALTEQHLGARVQGGLSAVWVLHAWEEGL